MQIKTINGSTLQVCYNHYSQEAEDRQPFGQGWRRYKLKYCFPRYDRHILTNFGSRFTGADALIICHKSSLPQSDQSNAKVHWCRCMALSKRKGDWRQYVLGKGYHMFVMIIMIMIMVIIIMIMVKGICQ